MPSGDFHLSDSVGYRGVNRHDDVLLVQQLVNSHLPTPLRPLRLDGLCGRLTVTAIEEVQRRSQVMRRPDGRIDPGCATFRFLTRSLLPSYHRPTYAANARKSQNQATRRVLTPPARPAATAGTSAPTQPSPTAAANGLTSDLIAAAQASQANHAIPAAVTLAQWALESNWGRAMPPGSNNPFGIKARKGEPFVEVWTHEVVHGKRIRIKAKFASFPTLDEAFDRHGALLATARPYAGARTRLPDPNGFVDALTGVYATDPNYGTVLKRLMRSHNFYQYDQLATPGSPPPPRTP